MDNKKPFTEEEQKIMDLIKEAHNEYCKLPPAHESAGTDWTNAIHALQDILIYRVVKRDYPTVFR